MFVPVDVVKERLQVQVSASSSSAGYKAAPPVYKGSLDALMQICRQEGLTGIYKGYGATLLSYGPFSALYFFLYEEVKCLILDKNSTVVCLSLVILCLNAFYFLLFYLIFPYSLRKGRDRPLRMRGMTAMEDVL